MLDLLKKLWEMIYGRKPVSRPRVPPAAEKPPPEKPAEKPAEAADQKTDAARKVADDLSDYNDGFDDDDDKDDDWDVDFGDNDLNTKKKVQRKEVGSKPADKEGGNKLK